MFASTPQFLHAQCLRSGLRCRRPAVSARSGGSMLTLLCSCVLWCGLAWRFARAARVSSAGPIVSRSSSVAAPVRWLLEARSRMLADTSSGKTKLADSGCTNKTGSLIGAARPKLPERSCACVLPDRSQRRLALPERSCACVLPDRSGALKLPCACSLTGAAAENSLTGAAPQSSLIGAALQSSLTGAAPQNRSSPKGAAPNAP